MDYIGVLLGAGLNRCHLNTFGEWAFGPDFRSIKTYDVPKVWNELHGDKLVLEQDGDLRLDTRKMVQIWQKLNDIPVIQYMCRSWDCFNKAEWGKDSCENCPNKGKSHNEVYGEPDGT